MRALIKSIYSYLSLYFSFKAVCILCKMALLYVTLEDVYTVYLFWSRFRHSSTLVIIIHHLLLRLQNLVARWIWPWPRWPRPWATSPGLTPKGLTPSSPLWRRRVVTPAATHRTRTASWDASPVAPTTPSPWRPSATAGARPTAPIKASRPVSEEVFSQWEAETNRFKSFQTWYFTDPVWDNQASTDKGLPLSLSLSVLQVRAVHRGSGSTGRQGTLCVCTGAAQAAATATWQRWWEAATTTTALHHLGRTAVMLATSSVETCTMWWWLRSHQRGAECCSVLRGFTQVWSSQWCHVIILLI